MKKSKQEELLKLVRRRTIANFTNDKDAPAADNVSALMDRAKWALENPNTYDKIYTEGLLDSVNNILDCVNRVVKAIPFIIENEKRRKKV